MIYKFKIGPSGPKKVGSRKFVFKTFWVKKIGYKKKFENIFWSKNIFSQEIVGKYFFWSQKYFGQKKFGLKKFCLQNLMPHRIGSKKCVQNCVNNS